MKKLMFAAAAIALAFNAQAVAVVWGSGFFMNPNSDGSLQGISWSGTKWTIDTAKTVKAPSAVEAFVWESASDLTFKSGDLYKWYADGKQGTPFKDITALTGTGTTSISINSASTAWNQGDTAYSAILYVLTDGEGKVWYQEDDVAWTVGNSKTTANMIADFVGGGAVTTPGLTVNSWTAAAVPEPTSGLLLLLGVAGLALRRRRA